MLSLANGDFWLYRIFQTVADQGSPQKSPQLSERGLREAPKGKPFDTAASR